eukprot:TRINITY_DN6160_c0_g1_i1.p1 TRINITY_DN6160_c0_g1~~TRINITY_DN6160_c0_g1_i1.p1  ORF type:complete len:599 (+),score=31.21 TRINITY_DN6160_c0_g1_i1:162-1958(+)
MSAADDDDDGWFRRRHGLHRPFDPLCIGAWCAIALYMFLFVFLVALILPIPVVIPVSVFFFLVLLVVAAADLGTALIDPSDPGSLLPIGPTANPSFPPAEHKYCAPCHSFVLAVSKHCWRCGKCVLHYDHHCRWLNTCVGRRNYRGFAVFITSILCGLVYHLAVCAGATASLGLALRDDSFADTPLPYTFGVVDDSAGVDAVVVASMPHVSVLVAPPSLSFPEAPPATVMLSLTSSSRSGWVPRGSASFSPLPLAMGGGHAVAASGSLPDTGRSLSLPSLGLATARRRELAHASSAPGQGGLRPRLNVWREITRHTMSDRAIAKLLIGLLVFAMLLVILGIGLVAHLAAVHVWLRSSGRTTLHWHVDRYNQGHAPADPCMEICEQLPCSPFARGRGRRRGKSRGNRRSSDATADGGTGTGVELASHAQKGDVTPVALSSAGGDHFGGAIELRSGPPPTVPHVADVSVSPSEPDGYPLYTASEDGRREHAGLAEHSRVGRLAEPAVVSASVAAAAAEAAQQGSGRHGASGPDAASACGPPYGGHARSPANRGEGSAAAAGGGASGREDRGSSSRGGGDEGDDLGGYAAQFASGGQHAIG